MPAPLLVSVVVPVHNEEGAIAQLVRALETEFSAHFPEQFEIIIVNDKSRDATLEVLSDLKSSIKSLRVLSHAKNCGQSRAVRSGVLAARGSLIVTLDGDGQNPPFEAPKLIKALLEAPESVGLVGGERQKRQDSAAKKWASVWANRLRKALLNDGANDTGCGLKAFRREAFLRLPYFDHMHRYLPALMVREGYACRYVPVSHQARETGQSKYTNLGRLMVAFADLSGVMWLNRRARLPERVDEV